MSQPEVLGPYISELGNTNLIPSRIINKKKDSFTKLTTTTKFQEAWESNVNLPPLLPIVQTPDSSKSKKGYKMPPHSGRKLTV